MQTVGQIPGAVPAATTQGSYQHQTAQGECIRCETPAEKLTLSRKWRAIRATYGTTVAAGKQCHGQTPNHECGTATAGRRLPADTVPQPHYTEASARKHIQRRWRYGIWYPLIVAIRVWHRDRGKSIRNIDAPFRLTKSISKPGPVCSEQILSRTHRLEVGSLIVTQALIGVLNAVDEEKDIVTLL